jgi:YVTN family beta-propeller protein
VYIATENRDTTVAVDVATRAVVAKIPVGKTPKRLITVTMR